ncbi:MAG: hypothetical protein VCE75_22945 [Alphaproteobacteria bacterium]
MADAELMIKTKDGSVKYDDYKWDMLSGTSTNNSRPLSVDQLSEAYKKLMAPINPKTMWGALMASTLSRDAICMKATGNEPLCRCLGKELLRVEFAWQVSEEILQ